MGPKKNQKMSLGTFLQDENFGSWADEMEDMPLPDPAPRTSTYGTDRRAFSTNAPPAGGMLAGYERNYQPREELPLPDKPPYTAHLANLSFDAGDLDVRAFFEGCEVTNVRIVEDKMDRKPKGFGYVEFGTLDGLKTALDRSGSSLAGRAVRISVADPPKDRQDARDFGDWSRKGPLPDVQGQRRVSDRPGYNRSFDNMSDAGSERGGRRGFGGDDGKQPNLSLREGGRQASKDGSFRRDSPSWGEGRSNDGSRPPRREYSERPPVPVREPTAADQDSQWRARMRPDAPPATESADSSTPQSPSQVAPAAPAAPASRPKLNLQKRTVAEAAPDSAVSAASDTKASPFGAARPVDTAQKEKEVEEKRQLAIRQKRETEEKAKAERAEEKKIAREKEAPKEKEKEKASAEPKENKIAEVKEGEAEEAEVGNGESQPASTPKFDILRRSGSNTNDMVAEEDEEDGEELGQAEDKAVKPQEIVREIPSTKSNGAWRKGQEAPAASAEDTSEQLEEDGWSTVSKPSKQRSNRKPNSAAARAIAS